MAGIFVFNLVCSWVFERQLLLKAIEIECFGILLNKIAFIFVQEEWLWAGFGAEISGNKKIVFWNE